MDKKLTIAVCDDDLSVVDIIANTIVSTFRTKGIQAQADVFNDALTLRRAMRDKSYALIFLDIDMPKMDGIEFAEGTQKNQTKTEIIFVSNREDRVFDALRLHPFGFVRKSNFLKDISAVIDSYLHTLRMEEGQVISVQTRTGVITLSPAEIVYVEGSGKKQVFHLSDDRPPLEVRGTMEKIEQELSEKGFLRIHKGYIVNYRYMRVIDGRDLALRTGERLPISRTKLQEIKQLYSRLLQGDGASIF